jgi:hypothetical protein
MIANAGRSVMNVLRDNIQSPHEGAEPVGVPRRFASAASLLDVNDRIPVIPHESLGADCRGCLVIRVRADLADIVCDECATVIRKVALEEVEDALLQLVQKDTVCTARCRKCGALNTFPGFSAIIAFICSRCHRGVQVITPVQ